MRSKKAVLVGILGVALGSTYVAVTAQAHDTSRCAHEDHNGQYWTIDYKSHTTESGQHFNYYTHYEVGGPYWHNEANNCTFDTVHH
ncbi:MAG TPA: hypothetical protein VHN37_00460 [Actinomycetota bacterium]|nr:hypothetical protein [Actinomycetota bacterium]